MSEKKKATKAKAVKKDLLKSDSDAAVDSGSSVIAGGSSKPKADAAQDARAQAVVKNNTDFNGVPEQIAQSKVKRIRHEWAGARQAFPHHKRLWYVDIFFPYAEGGPLFVDQVKNDAQKEELSEKLNTMKKLGHRYLQIENGMSLNEALELVA